MRLTTALCLLFIVGCTAMTAVVLICPDKGTEASGFAAPVFVVLGVACMARHEREHRR
jgi:preprotein translocase subunit SecG